MNELSGRLFLGGLGNGFILNLKSGLLSRIPNVDWNYTSIDNDGYESTVRYSATSNSDGTEFLLAVDRCAESSDPSFSLLRDDCLEIRDSITGARIKRGRLTPDIKSGAKFSRDGNYVAFFHYDQRLSQPDDSLIIADREFNIIRQPQLYESYALAGGQSLDWTDNGKLLYSYGNTIYITAQYETEGIELKNFVNSNSMPVDVSVSPDGSKVAFLLLSSTTHATRRGEIWVMNIDGSDLHRLTHDPDNTGEIGLPHFEFPTWSPNGDYILCMYGHVTGSGDINVGAAGSIYAIPSNGRDISIEDSSVIKVRMIVDGEMTHDASFRGNWAWLN